MESHERDSADINRETAEEQAQGGHFDREGGAESAVVEDSDAVPTPTDIDEELEDRGDV
jgi:hypothetical protein